MFIYLDTMLWNDLCDQGSDAHALIGSLAVKNHDYTALSAEVTKLSLGDFDGRAETFIANRKQLAANARQATTDFLRSNPRLRHVLRSLPESNLQEWLSNEVPGPTGQRMLLEHVLATFPGAPADHAASLVKKMATSKACRVSHSMVRGDLYLNWRCAQTGSIPADLHDDLFHVVNACYCDVYATREVGQLKYGPLILTQTQVARYNNETTLMEWLLHLTS